MATQNINFLLSAKDGASAAFNSAQQAAQRLRTVMSGLGTTLTAVGASLVTAKFGAFVKGSIDAADALNDLSKRFGTTVETLAGFDLLARQSGVTLESLATGLKALSQQISTSPKDMASLGVTTKNATEAFIQLAEIFDRLPADADRTTLALKLFGRAGESLLPAFEGGSRAVRELIEKSQGLNRVTADAAARADAFNDRMEELKTSLAGAGTEISQTLLPGLQKSADAMAKLAQEGSPALALLRGFVGLGKVPWDLLLPTEGNAVQLKEISARIAEIQKQAQPLRDALSSGKTKDPLGIFTIKLNDTTLDKARNKLSALENEVKLLQERANKITQPPVVPERTVDNDLAARVRKLVGGKDGGAAKQITFEGLLEKNALARLKEADRAFEEADESARRLEERLENLIGDTPARQAEKLKGDVELLSQAFEDGKIPPIVYGQALVKLNGTIDPVAEHLKDLKQRVDGVFSQTAIERAKRMQDEFDEINRRIEADPRKAAAGEQAKKILLGIEEQAEKTNDIAKELGLTFTSFFEDAIVGGKKFSEVLKGLGQDILKLFVRKTVTEPAAEKLSDLFKNIDLTKILGSVFGSGGSVPAYASGTPYVPRTGLALVHEGEAIIPRSQNNGGGATISYSPTYHIDSRTDRRQIQADIDAANRKVIADIANMTQRGQLNLR